MNVKSPSFLALVLLLSSAAFAGFGRDLRLPEVLGKGDVGLKNVSVTDDAAWIWSERDDARFVRFRCDFESDGTPLRIHVTADNRYTLYLDAARIGRGPDRGYPDHWTFRSYELALTPGRHRLEAVVTFATEASPLAQLSSGKPGFLLRAEGDAYGRQLTTGKGVWRARVFDNVTFREPEVGAFGVGKTVRIDGSSPWDDVRETDFGKTKVVRAAVGAGSDWGCARGLPYLYPATLPAQLDEVKRPGRAVAAVTGGASDYLWRTEDRAHPAVAAFNRHLREGAPIEIPAKTTWSVLWDLEDYYCAYPELEVSPGTGDGLDVKWSWAESLARPETVGPFGALDKGNRGEFAGKCFKGFEDESVHRGGAEGEGMSTPWWRCGRWCRLTFATGENPATIRRLAIAETRYPLAHGWSFDCDDTTVAPILRICRRGLEMNSHEMSFDCPYYEQQMYGGDSRIQFLVHAAMASDDRLVRRNIDLFDWSRRPDGRIGMNTPTRGTQDSTSFTFMWPMMLADYARWHDNRAWLRSKLPGLLHTMEGLHAFERADGLLADLPGWNFVDWTTWPGKKARFGEPKDVDRLSGILNLFYLYSLRSAADVCEVLGEPDYAAAFRRRYDRTAAATVKTFWCARENLLSDTDTMDSFSQHAQALAVVLGLLPSEKDALVRAALLSRKDLVPCTVSFRHYLFEALSKMGRGDRILEELDLWRGYVAKDLKTGQEMPDPSRSDCHGWSSHPVYHLLTTVAGVTPAAPFFGKVRVAPQPGNLKFVRAAVPTPKGAVSVDLRFDGTSASGTVTLPAGLSGDFEFRDLRQPLVPGVNTIGTASAAAPYRDGDTVVFFGDSITHGGRYHVYITDFYRTRFPEADIRFVNSGIGGDTARAAFGRIPVDVAEYAPTHVAVHFGMNDIGRGSYGPTSTAQTLIDREAAQERYRKDLPRLIAEIRRVAPQARLTYLTPTHYDDTAVITNAPPNWSGWASVNNVGCNVGLSLMAGYVLSAARRDGVDAVDWHSLMSNFIAERRKTDRHFMTTRIDRVHPEALGHSLMAWEFLKRQGVDPVVSAVAVDAAECRVTAVTNAVADAVVSADGGVSFDLLAKALPFPVPSEALDCAKAYDVERTLNLETVAVTGLAPGRYVLEIDGEPVATCSASDLARGVRLGFNAKTPQYRQAQAVFARVEELSGRERVLRGHHSARWYYGLRGAPVDDVKAFAQWFEKNEPNKDAYFAKFVPGYLAYWPTYRETRDRLWADQRAVRELARPVRRHYVVRPVR